MLRALFVALVLVACSNRATTPPPVSATPEPAATTDAGTTHGDAAKASGEACLVASECASGICEGQGCDAENPGICAAETRACTRDLQTYCSCDGAIFRTSGSCPGQRYEKKGPC
jgi:hypothetical protein